MKVIAINGSPRREGNTAIVLRRMAEELAKHSIETEIIGVGAGRIQGCTSCFKCRESLESLCVIGSDNVNETTGKLRAADGVILGARPITAVFRDR